MKDIKILLTGGSGFIGTHLIEYLKNDYDLSVYDINKPNSNKVDFIKGDIHDKKLLLETIPNHEIIIHLAASVGVKSTEADPILTLNTNLLGTKNLLESCSECNIKKLIFSSSSEVYGEPTKIPIDESQIPMPITTYGISKLTAEEYVKAYGEKFGFKYSILRFFNAIGPNQAKNFVMPEFIFHALNNTPIIIHGSGLQIRAFCDIEDICQGIEKCISKGDNEIINIGNSSEPISIEDLAKKIITLLNSKSEIKFIPFEQSGRNRSFEIISRVPDIRKAKNLISYEPKYDLEHSITTIKNSM